MAQRTDASRRGHFRFDTGSLEHERFSVSTCPPRGDLVDGLPRAPSLIRIGVSKFLVNGSQNEDSSKSVCSFVLGAIFLHSRDQKLSRNAFVVSVYASGAELA